MNENDWLEFSEPVNCDNCSKSMGWHNNNDITVKVLCDDCNDKLEKEFSK